MIPSFWYQPRGGKYMKNIRIAAVALLLILPALAFSIDIQMANGARLEIVSRTSFGIDIDNPYDFGLKNELTQLDLIINLLPYQEISNKGNTSDAVGFINVTLQDLSLIKWKNQKLGWNDGEPIWTDGYQTTAFIAGIAKGPWLAQFHAGGNEYFRDPWYKGMQYINDGFKFSWAYLDSMVDIKRINAISGIPVITKRGEENMEKPGSAAANDTMLQFGFKDNWNIADRFGPDISGQMVAVMYNTDSFGLNFKLGTEYPFGSKSNTEKNMNGLAFGLDSVFMPYPLPGLKIFASLVGTYNYGKDKDPDPFIGGTRIGYNIPLSYVISVEPWVGLDIGTKFKDAGGAEKPEYEASFGATMRWPGASGWQRDYILNTEGRVYPGMSVGYKIYQNLEKGTDPEHSIKFTLFEPRGDQGMFYRVGSEMVIDIIDITNINFGKTNIISGVPPQAAANDPRGGFSILGTVYLDYEIGKLGAFPGMLLPWTILYYDNIPGRAKKDDRLNDFKIDLGINLEKAIKNVTFGLVWNSGSLIQKSAAGYMRLFVEIRL